MQSQGSELLNITYNTIQARPPARHTHVPVDLRTPSHPGPRSRLPSRLTRHTRGGPQADVKISETETQIGAVVHVLQIDNQLMTATKPVMLAPNARSTAGLERQDDGTMAVTPMIVFQVQGLVLVAGWECQAGMRP